MSSYINATNSVRATNVFSETIMQFDVIVRIICINKLNNSRKKQIKKVWQSSHFDVTIKNGEKLRCISTLKFSFFCDRMNT